MIAAMTAWYLAETHKRRVALIDLDLQYGDAALQLDVEHHQGRFRVIDQFARAVHVLRIADDRNPGDAGQQPGKAAPKLRGVIDDHDVHGSIASGVDRHPPGDCVGLRRVRIERAQHTDGTLHPGTPRHTQALGARPVPHPGEPLGWVAGRMPPVSPGAAPTAQRPHPNGRTRAPGGAADGARRRPAPTVRPLATPSVARTPIWIR